jgi:hypothetical protein
VNHNTLEMSYDDDDDFALSGDNDDDISPGALKKEEIDSENQHNDGKTKQTTGTSMDQSSSFDMNDFEVDDTDTATTTAATVSNITEAAPSSIENVIAQVNNMTVPSKAAPEKVSAKKALTPNKKVKTQSSVSVVSAGKKDSSSLSRKVVKKKPSASSRVEKKGSFQEKGANKGVACPQTTEGISKPTSSSTVTQAGSKAENDDDEYDLNDGFDDESAAHVTENENGALVSTNAQSTQPINRNLKSDLSKANHRASGKALQQSASKPTLRAEECADGKTLEKSKSAAEVKRNTGATKKVKGSAVSGVSKSGPVSTTNTGENTPAGMNNSAENKNSQNNKNLREDNEYEDVANDFEDEECGTDQATNDEATAKGKSQDIANSVIASPQKSRPPPDASSPQRGRKTTKTKKGGDIDYDNKISQLDKKIREIAAEREKYSPTKKIKRKKFPKVLKKSHHPPRRSKKLTHTKLKFIMADVSISPYMTAPDAKYSKETLRLPEIIRNAKYDEPGMNLPFDEKQMEERFINEVYNYKKPDMF